MNRTRLKQGTLDWEKAREVRIGGSEVFDISALMPVIEKEFGKRFDKLNKRVKSYTDKKGQHPAKRK